MPIVPSIAPALDSSTTLATAAPPVPDVAPPISLASIPVLLIAVPVNAIGATIGSVYFAVFWRAFPTLETLERLVN